MIGTILPIANYSAGRGISQSAFGSQSAVDSQGFAKILLSQMASPDLSALFAGENETASGSSFFGNTGTASGLAGLLGGGSLGSLNAASSSSQGNLFAALGSPQMELSIFSNLIGKNIEAFDTLTGASLAGSVKSVVILDGQTKLEVGDKFVSPFSVVKAS